MLSHLDEIKNLKFKKKSLYLVIFVFALFQEPGKGCL